jgi:hypothetical protein
MVRIMLRRVVLRMGDIRIGSRCRELKHNLQICQYEARMP